MDGYVVRVKEGLCHSGLFTCLAKCYESTQEMSLGENSILNGKQQGRTNAVIFDTEFISPLWLVIIYILLNVYRLATLLLGLIARSFPPTR